MTTEEIERAEYEFRDNVLNANDWAYKYALRLIAKLRAADELAKYLLSPEGADYIEATRLAAEFAKNQGTEERL